MGWHNIFTDCGDLGGCAFPDPVPPSLAGVPSTIVEVFVRICTFAGVSIFEALEVYSIEMLSSTNGC
jgi:hypothetical protein